MIGGRIKRARTAAGLSISALAKLVEVSAYEIKKYESNHRTPSSPVLIKLCVALSVRAEYFFRQESVVIEVVRRG